MTFGLQDEWKFFGENHPDFAAAFGSLTALIEHSLAIVPPGSAAQNIAYQMRRECVENYMEILVLAGNGYGHAAWRELRSMYEKAVTAHHLLSNPEDVDRFVGWTAVSKYRTLMAMKETEWPVEVSLSPEKEAKVIAEYEAIKPLFESTLCKKCGKKGVGASWHKSGFVEMAKQAGGLTIYLVPAYYEGLLYGHPSYFGVLQKNDKGSDYFNPQFESQPKEAFLALKFAHAITMEICAQHLNSMKLQPVPELVSKAVDDFNRAWNPDLVL